MQSCPPLKLQPLTPASTARGQRLARQAARGRGPRGARRGTSDTPPIASSRDPSGSAASRLGQESLKSAGSAYPSSSRLSSSLTSLSSYIPSAPATGSIAVCFSINYSTRIGQEIFITGSHPLLGDWKGETAVPLAWTPGNEWKVTLKFPAGTILFYKYFLREDGYLKQWQGGNNIMLVVPNSATGLPNGLCEAKDSWDGSPSALSATSESRILARLRDAEERRMAAEAAANAAGMVAQSVMRELIIAREEAAQALRFLQGRGLTEQVAAFAKAMGPAAMQKLNEHMSANPSKYPDVPYEGPIGQTKAQDGAGASSSSSPPPYNSGSAGGVGSRPVSSSAPFVPSDADIDREIDELLGRETFRTAADDFDVRPRGKDEGTGKGSRWGP